MQRQMRTYVLACLALLAALVAGLVWGVYAGRHDGFPAPAVVAAKMAVEKVLAPELAWRRDFFEDTDAATLVPCPTGEPIVILTGGQSNAANALSDPVDENPSLRAFMFHKGRCYRLRDPVLGVTGDRGSLWTALGHRLAAETGRDVVFINGGVGGTTYRDWLNLHTGYFDRLRKLVEDAARHGLRPHWVLWHQGESDALRNVPSEVFEGELKVLIGRLMSERPLADVKLVLYAASVCYGSDRRLPQPRLRQAQRRAAELSPNVLMGPDTDRYGARFRYDDCHFNGPGRDAIVDETAKLLIPMIIGRR
jgi:hypothetical protein